MRFWKILSCLLVSLCSVYSFNHPEIKWKTVSTEHFSINYYDKTAPALYATWKIAEETYSALAPLFDYKFRSKIDLTIADYDDYSNGWADYTSPAIMIWLPDANFDYRGSSTWLRNVISHEITHLLSLESKKSRQMIDISLNISLTTPSEELIVQEPFARMTMWPNWLAEGIAQAGSEKLGHDCWDSRREMLLRTAAMSNTLLTIDEMGNFAHDSRGNEMVYNQGYSFVKFLENHIGLEQIAAVFKAGSLAKTGIDQFFTEKTGRTLESYYGEWKDSLEEHYSVVLPSPDSHNEIIYNRGLINSKPEISPDGKLWGWLSSGRDDAGQTDLIICDNGKTDAKIRIRYVHTSWSFSKDSRKIYFIRSRDPDKSGSYLNDVFIYDINTKKTVRLTRGLRAYDIAVSPVNGAVSVITYNKGVFSVSLLDINTGNVKEMTEGTMGEPFISCTWSSKDSTRFAAQRVVNGRSQISLYSVFDTAVKSLSSGKGREESPFWAPDSRIYFSADYDGIYNIYSCKDDGSDLLRHTDAVGGCFSPFAGSMGKILYSGYSTGGFTVEKVFSEGRPYEIPSVTSCSFKPLPQPKGKVLINANKYVPHYGRSLLEIQIFGLADFKDELIFERNNDTIDEVSYFAGAAILKYRQDPIQKKSKTLGISLGLAGLYTGDDSSSDNNNDYNWKSSTCQYLMKNTDKNFFRNTIKMKNEIPHSRLCKNEVLSSRLELMLAKNASESEESDDSSFSPEAIPILQPMYSLTNSESRATLQMDIYASMVYMILPAVVVVNPTLQWELSRTSSAGIGVNAEIYPFSGMGAGEIPLSFIWNNLGKYNEDVNYNYGNYSQWTLFCGPQFVPVSIITDYSNGDSDTSTAVHNSLFAQTEFFHGFSIAKYMSLQVDIAGRLDFFDTRVPNDILDDIDSKTLLQTSSGLKFVFPVSRNINRGSLYFFDNFYGAIGYSLIGVVNREFFELDHYSSELLTDTSFTKNASIGHMISVNLTMGHYKSNNYFKKFVIDFNYEILRDKIFLKVASEF